MAGYRLRVHRQAQAEAQAKVRRTRPARRLPADPLLPREPKLVRVQFECRCCECGLKILRFTNALWLGGGRVCCEDCPGQVTTAEELLGPDFG